MQKLPRVILQLESSRASGRSLLRGIADYARHHGPWAFYWEPGGLRDVWPKLASLDAQGIILRDVDRVEEVLAHGLPAVVVGHSQKEIPGLANVITDSEAIGRMAAEHLIRCGFQQFAFCGFEGAPWSEVRGAVFDRCIRAAGYQTHFYKPPTTPAPATGKEELRFMAKWLKSLPKPIGLMACNDDRGQHVIEACKIAGLRVPDEVAVLGADNDELVCELSDPPMSSIAINFERAGYESAQMLDKLMHRKRTASATITVHVTHVVARQSTDILMMSDPYVAKALRFIREHAKENLDVATVAKAAGLSRRALEKRFKTLLSRSILTEIRRVRVDLIARMLVETNLPVAHIADALGYENIQHIARYFRKEKQMTPLAYRKRHGQK